MLSTFSWMTFLYFLWWCVYSNLFSISLLGSLFSSCVLRIVCVMEASSLLDACFVFSPILWFDFSLPQQCLWRSRRFDFDEDIIHLIFSFTVCAFDIISKKIFAIQSLPRLQRFYPIFAFRSFIFLCIRAMISLS